MPLRILLASDFFPPFIGGAELQTRVLAHELARRGHSVTVATVWHAGLPEVEQQSNVVVHRLHGLATSVDWLSSDAGRRFHPPMPDPGITRGLRRLVREFQPDLVHASGWIGFSCAAVLDGMRPRPPLVLSVRDYGYTCALRSLMHGDEICDGPAVGKCIRCASPRFGVPKALGAVAAMHGSRALLKRNVSAIHCVSRFVETTMRRDFLAGPPETQTTTVRTIPDMFIVPSNGTASTRCSGLNGQAADHADYADYLGQLPDEPFILFVGGLQLHKGLAPLLAAYERLATRPPLVLIGSVWPDTPDHFPAGVRVLRDVPHAVVMLAWKRSLFGVVPSIWADPLPGTVREAMSAGKAVIGSAAGGIIDMVVDGETGLLVPLGDVEALARAMHKLIGDPELCARMGQAGLERTAVFSAEAILPCFEALYYQLVEQRQPA